MPLENRVMMSKMEALMQIYNDRMELQGERYRINEDQRARSLFRKYLELVRAEPVGPIKDYVTVERLQAMPRGRARGRDVYLRNGPVHIDIAWYQQIAEEDQEKLCKVLERPEVQEVLGKEGRVSLLVKKDHLPAAKGNLRGITIAPHISKLQLSAYYAERGMQAYEKALGGPLMVGGVKGVSMVEVVRKVMMAIDISIITDTVVDIAISDLSQYYDIIPQDAHPEVGEAIGLGTKEELQ